MQNQKKPHALALVVFCLFSAVIAAGCSCDDNEFDGATACQKLVDAANGVLTGCGLSAVADTDVCAFSIGDCVGYLGCSPTVDVNACVTAIKAMDCNGVSARSYATLTECTPVLDNIQTACAPSNSSDSDSDFD